MSECNHRYDILLADDLYGQDKIYCWKCDRELKLHEAMRLLEKVEPREKTLTTRLKKAYAALREERKEVTSLKFTIMRKGLGLRTYGDFDKIVKEQYDKFKKWRKENESAE